MKEKIKYYPTGIEGWWTQNPKEKKVQIKQLKTLDRVFQNYLEHNDNDEEARDLYIKLLTPFKYKNNMTIKDLINQLEQVENKDKYIHLLGNLENAEDEDKDIIFNDVEVWDDGDESITLFIT